MADLSLNLVPRPDASTLRTNNGGLRNGTGNSRPLREKEQQELKSAVHQELINRLDLEKLGEAQETRAGQQQLFAVTDLNVSPKWEINFGVGVGATAGTDHIIVKGIIGRHFSWGKQSPVD